MGASQAWLHPVLQAQDIQILVDLHPNRTPLSKTKEVLMPADKAIVAYRDWLEKFDDMGWRIDVDEFNRRNGKDTAFAIPSPDRRTSGNWVVEELPRIKNRAERKKIEKAA
jgi:hypothetical protein